MDLNILYEDNHLIVVVKEPNIPVQADDSKDLDLLTILKKYLKEKYHKPGNVYLGMVHRLDRPVGGIIVLAKTSKAASRLSEQIRNRKFAKKYVALVHGEFKNNNGEIINYLVKDPKTFNSSIVDKNIKEAKEAKLFYKVLNYNDIKNVSLLEVTIETGRHHQIRVQLMGIGHPIVGDQRYGTLKEKGIQIHLWSSQLSFKHPVKDEMMTFTNYPNWFNENNC